MIHKLMNELDAFKGVIKVIIRDVGHGNWNEISFGTTRIFFDIGAQKDWNESKIEEIVTAVDIKANDKIYIFISHWDVDHYHAILKLSNSELKQIKGFFAPYNIPKTNTAKRVKNHLKSAGISINKIPFTLKRFTNKKIELNLLYRGSILKLYRSTRTNSRNLDSIVLYLETSKRSVLLTGDQKYEKLYEYIVSPSSPKSPMILVIPHHGGAAGNFNKADWSTVSIEEIVISFHESNSYGHPTKENVKIAESLLRTKSILCTNDTGDKLFIV